MGYNKELFLNMVNSGVGMMFAYDKGEDRLYLSLETQKELGIKSVVRSYWKDSGNWNWIPQQEQEVLVNILRQDGPADKIYVCHVEIRRKRDEKPVPYRLEMSVLRNGGADGEIIGVKGVMYRETDR